MHSITAPEITALEAFLQALLDQKPSDIPSLQVIDSAYRSTHDATDDPLIDLMRTLLALPGMIAELPSGGVQTTAKRCCDALHDAFKASTLALHWAGYLAAQQSNLIIASSTVSVLHDIKFDGPAFTKRTDEVNDAIDSLAQIFANSGMSHQSISILDAQLNLMKRSVGRFEETGVGPFRDSCFSVIGRVVIQIERDEAINDAQRATLVKNVMSVVGVISAIGDIASLAGPVVQLLLPGPSA